MIKRVYQTNKELIKEEVEEEIVKKVEKTIYIDVEHTRTIHHGPSSSGNCLHCKRKLTDSMWIYGNKSNKYLCKSCWYSLSISQRDEYRKKAIYGYDSTERYIVKEPKKVVNEIKEKVKKIKEYYITNSELLFPVDIKYPTNNNVFYNEISVDNLLPETITHIKADEDLKWYGVNSIENYKNVFSCEHKRKSVNFNYIREIPYNEYILDEYQTLEEFNDIVGFYPNVPLYIQGYPLNMHNNIRKNELVVEKTVTLFLNLAIDSKFDKYAYQNRGIIIYQLYKHLRSLDIQVRIKFIDASFINGETIIQVVDVTNKYMSDNDLFIYNILTSIAFYRIAMLEHRYKFIKDYHLSPNWDYGFGYTVSNEMLKNILTLDDNDILIGRPEEHNITGNDLDEDFFSCMNSLGLWIKNEKQKEFTYKKESLRQIIQRRKIKKIIHVTSSKNIESIKSRGLLPVETLEQKGIVFSRNDFQRLENHKDAICLSVTNPNHFLFSRYKEKYPSTKFVVIELDPRVLYENEDKTIYYDYNAASKFSSWSTNIQVMFKDSVKILNRIHTRDGKKSYEPTCTQAEILFFGRIDPKYILGFYDYDNYIGGKKKNE